MIKLNINGKDFMSSTWAEIFDEIEKMFSPERSKKPNNNVSKNMKGNYDLSIHGNKITLTDKDSKITVESRCHPDDEFNIGIGMTEAFEKMDAKKKDGIKLGDWVTIPRPDCSAYTTNVKFFYENDLTKEAPYFRYGVIPSSKKIYQVIYIKGPKALVREDEGFHFGMDEYNDLACSDGLFIVALDGLEKVKG